jgi:carbon-monoxide dehydrogenase medium subunit
MKPPVFEYHDPATVEEALDLLSRYGDDAKILAGGQSLMPMLNFRLARPAHLIDINRVGGLARVSRSSDTLTLGAMTRQRALERSAQVYDWCPLLRQALALVGHPQIRNRGTLGGSLAHADPAAELPAVALALDARLVLRRSGGQRVVTARDFFVTQLTTVVQPNELLVEVQLPARPANTGYGIQEVAMRRGDFALGGMITVLAFGADRRIEAARVVGFGVADRPIRIETAEAALVGAKPTGEAFAAAAALVSQAVDPSGDIHASAAYRRRLSGVLTKRALAESAAPAKELVR